MGSNNKTGGEIVKDILADFNINVSSRVSDYIFDGLWKDLVDNGIVIIKSDDENY